MTDFETFWRFFETDRDQVSVVVIKFPVVEWNTIIFSLIFILVRIVLDELIDIIKKHSIELFFIFIFKLFFK